MDLGFVKKGAGAPFIELAEIARVFYACWFLPPSLYLSLLKVSSRSLQTLHVVVALLLYL